MLGLFTLARTALAAEPDPSPALGAVEREQEALFEKVAPSVVFIATHGAFGSGFFVSADGLVLTNAHVVDTSKEVDVVLRDGRKLKGEVLERGANGIDLALVKVPVDGMVPLVLDELSDVKVGSFVASVGHGQGAIWTFNTGMVSNIYPVGAERPVLQTQIPLNHGNSGGPVVDRRGRVVGIVAAGLENSNSINFAIRSDVAARVLTRLAQSAAVLVITAPEGVPVFVDGVGSGQGPRAVVAVTPGPHEVFAVIRGKLDRRRVVFPAVRTVDLGELVAVPVGARSP